MNVGMFVVCFHGFTRKTFLLGLDFLLGFYSCKEAVCLRLALHNNNNNFIYTAPFQTKLQSAYSAILIDIHMPLCAKSLEASKPIKHLQENIFIENMCQFTRKSTALSTVTHFGTEHLYSTDI